MTESGLVAFKRARKTKISRGLRKKQTPSESRLWQKIRNKKVFGYKFRRQHAILGFVVDFYSPELKLAIEIDGVVHEHQKDYDQFRQEALERTEWSSFESVPTIQTMQLFKL